MLGGSVEIEDGAVLEGDLAVFGGDVEVDGTVEGNVVVFGGDVDVLGNAYVEGDLALIRFGYRARRSKRARSNCWCHAKRGLFRPQVWSSPHE